MATSSDLWPDRHIHARMSDGAEVARYSRAGKYYLEPRDGKRSVITLARAVEIAAQIVADGGQITESNDRGRSGVVIVRQYGGQAFDVGFRRAVKGTRERRR